MTKAIGKVLILDTSVLCTFLQIPNMDDCGPQEIPWTFEKIDKKLKEEEALRTSFVLPLAVVIETGNHISHAGNQRHELAKKFGEILDKTANVVSPWVAFGKQTELWDEEGLKNLSSEWTSLAHRKFSLADTTIKLLAEYYAEQGFEVEILTADRQLKSYEPAPKPRKRRRSDR